MLPGRLIGQIDDALQVWMVPLTGLREQDMNARVMAPEMLQHLAATVEREKHLEGLPYCVARDRDEGEGAFEIVSGHHRARAARMAGLQEIAILADMRELTPDQIRGKQLAHNAIEGQDDPDTLRRMYLGIADVNARLETFLDPARLNIPLQKGQIDVRDLTLGFRWHTVALVFLPHQKHEWDRLVDRIPHEAEQVGVVPEEVFESFTAACKRLGRQEDIRHLGMMVSRMVEIVNAHLDSAAVPDGPPEGPPDG